VSANTDQVDLANVCERTDHGDWWNVDINGATYTSTTGLISFTAGRFGCWAVTTVVTGAVEPLMI